MGALQLPCSAVRVGYTWYNVWYPEPAFYVVSTAWEMVESKLSMLEPFRAWRHAGLCQNRLWWIQVHVAKQVPQNLCQAATTTTTTHDRNNHNHKTWSFKVPWFSDVLCDFRLRRFRGVVFFRILCIATNYAPIDCKCMQVLAMLVPKSWFDSKTKRSLRLRESKGPGADRQTYDDLGFQWSNWFGKYMEVLDISWSWTVTLPCIESLSSPSHDITHHALHSRLSLPESAGRVRCSMRQLDNYECARLINIYIYIYHIHLLIFGLIFSCVPLHRLVLRNGGRSTERCYLLVCAPGLQ